MPLAALLRHDAHFRLRWHWGRAAMLTRAYNMIDDALTLQCLDANFALTARPSGPTSPPPRVVKGIMPRLPHFYGDGCFIAT